MNVSPKLNILVKRRWGIQTWDGADNVEIRVLESVLRIGARDPGRLGHDEDVAEVRHLAVAVRRHQVLAVRFGCNLRCKRTN